MRLPQPLARDVGVRSVVLWVMLRLTLGVLGLAVYSPWVSGLLEPVLAPA